jgi:hypothetical protein
VNARHAMPLRITEASPASPDTSFTWYKVKEILKRFLLAVKSQS